MAFSLSEDYFLIHLLNPPILVDTDLVVHTVIQANL